MMLVQVLGGYNLCEVFTDAHELMLRKYLLRVYTLYFGLTVMEIRKLSQMYAVKPEDNSPMNGQENYLSRHLLL